MVFWLVTDVWARMGWFGYTFCVGLPRGSRVVPVSAAWLRASFGWLFPFLFGRAFIEARGLLRPPARESIFPFLFGRAFIEAPRRLARYREEVAEFPFLFGRAFIEAAQRVYGCDMLRDFPSFSEGLSLRQRKPPVPPPTEGGFPFLFGRAFIEAVKRAVLLAMGEREISLPFRKGFH